MLDAREQARRRELYDEGLSDRAIAETLGLHRRSVQAWRQAQGLFRYKRSGGRNITQEAEAQRQRLYDQGLTDQAIADTVGCTVRAIWQWRRIRRLQAHHPGCTITAAENAQRMLLYQLGWTDDRIARERGVTSQGIFGWRTRRGMPCNNHVGSIAPGINDLVARIRRQIGHYLSRDIADDVLGDLCEALLSGKLALADVEREARRYGNRTLERFASKYGPRSIDEEIGEDGFTLLDTLADDGVSSWLEEMGATVW